MALVKQVITEHDVVELLDDIGRWPAGTSGTVVDERGDSKFVEISDNSGVALDYVVASVAQLAPVGEHRA